MPSPIKPVHSLQAHDEIFENNSGLGGGGFSSLQEQLLGGYTSPAFTSREAAKLPDEDLALLEQIEKSQDDLVTVAQSLASNGMRNGQYFRVPEAISDNTLLRLKTQGLISGNGRLINFTDRGRVALRTRYLNSPNEFRESRTSTRFDYNAARGVTAGEEVEVRTSSSKLTRRIE